MSLDPFQQEAVDCNDPHIQIAGHPGTGKTMVMGNRIARLMREGTPPESIVALTFSNSARASLKERLITLLGDAHAASAVEVNTFHSFCADKVSKYPEDVGLTSEWRMADQLDLYNLLGDPSLGLPLKYRAIYPQGYTRDARERFQERLAQDKSYDFDAAMEFGCQIARKRDLGFRHLLIDEFQDIQLSQWELVEAMVGTNPALNVCVVGDANQEIFAFRKDHLRDAFRVMQNTFPNTRVLDLKYNYRSSPEILRTFEAIVPRDSPHRPELISTRPMGLEPELCIFPSAVQEMVALCTLVARLKKTYRPRDIAVLVRYNRQALQIKQELEMNDIEATSTVNVRALASRALPNLTISLLKWANEPRDLYLAQLLYNKHHKFISDQDYERLCRDSNSMVDALSQLDGRYSNHPFLVSHLPQIGESLRSCATPAELIKLTIATAESWKHMAGGRKTRTPAAAGWLEFTSLLHKLKIPLEKSLVTEPEGEPGRVLKAVLRQLFHNNEFAGEDRIHVQTIHSAKSREWPAVIVVGANPKFVPFDHNEDDERRLLYVAASRAREQLYFMGANIGGESNFVKFLRQQSPRTLLNPREAARLYPNVYKHIVASTSVGRQLLL